MTLLEVDNLSIDFITGGKLLPVVTDVSFKVNTGEILAIVGESGCGKSVSCMGLTKLLPSPPAKYNKGQIKFQHKDKSCNPWDLSSKKLRQIRGGGIAYIFQEPAASLNPVFTIGDQIAEAIVLHCPKVTDVKAEIIKQLTRVGIPSPETRLNAYPHELSGGMQQRAMIAMALACNPDLLIADEPTTALDVTVQAQILELLLKLRDSQNMTIIIVTHNLGIVSEIADKVMIMYAGNSVESGKTAEVLRSPRHPYTTALLKAVPKLGYQKEKLQTISGTVPAPGNYPAGCRFYDRCEHRKTLNIDEQNKCATQCPKWEEIANDHFCRCWFQL